MWAAHGPACSEAAASDTLLQLFPVGCARHLLQLTHLMERIHFNECSFTSLQVPLGSLHCLLIPHAALQAKLDLD